MKLIMNCWFVQKLLVPVMKICLCYSNNIVIYQLVCHIGNIQQQYIQDFIIWQQCNLAWGNSYKMTMYHTYFCIWMVIPINIFGIVYHLNSIHKPDNHNDTFCFLNTDWIQVSEKRLLPFITLKWFLKVPDNIPDYGFYEQLQLKYYIMASVDYQRLQNIYFPGMFCGDLK